MDIGGIDKKDTIEGVKVDTVCNVGGEEEIDTKNVVGTIEEMGEAVDEVLIGTVWNAGGAKEIDTKNVVWTLEEMGEEVDEDSEDEKSVVSSGSEEGYGWWLEEPWTMN